ncbi:hypothetical protein ALP03_200004 [Pseudomonas amygdali pv. tabaci]|uniref:Uncharacterized protein n=1 Tax=Pseudomonas amygdali pv. tabaci TaxID=322 RepID=A0A3M6HBT7_PSEAJ|nr:hypothetical protein ALP03_200004 [Pseudomonas amygdali pv. tabaci]
MEKSFSDHISEISEVSENNPLLKNLMLGSFFNNLPDEVSRNIKKTLSTYLLKPRAKIGWQCQHNGCDKNSCSSHEISENAVLKNISSPDSTVVILKRDIKNNPIFYVEGAQHKRNATNFPGYCSEHDAALFSDIDSGDAPFDIHYVNKQCLRTTRTQIFEMDFQIKACSLFIDDVPEDIGGDEVILEVIRHFNDKKNGLALKKQRLWSVYNKIYDGIESKNYALNFRRLPLGIAGFCFSVCVDLTLDTDKEPCLLYAYKLDLRSSSETFVAYLDNEISKSFSDYFAEHYKIEFGNFMYENKSKLILSKDLASRIPADVKEVLYKDHELYLTGPIEHYFISTAFFQ